MKVTPFTFTDDTVEGFHAKTKVMLHQWLINISAMAVYHAHIAYGSASYETKVFNDILDEWTKSYIIYEVPPSKNKEDSELVDYTMNHVMTCEYISSLY